MCLRLCITVLAGRFATLGHVTIRMIIYLCKNTKEGSIRERKRRTDGTNEVTKEQKCKNKTSRKQDSPRELRRCVPVYGLGRQDKIIQIRFKMIPVLCDLSTLRICMNSRVSVPTRSSM